MPHDVVVVLPTYDEVDNLATAVRRIGAHPVRLLIVDDNSPDGTGELADALAAADPDHIRVHHRIMREGLGAAYADGFSVALATSPDVVCQMDADLSHDAAELARLVAAVVGGADVAIGSRYVPGGETVGWPRRRRWLSRGGNWYAATLLGLHVADATSGFRAYRAEALQELDPASTRSSGYAFQVEMTLRAVRAGLTVVEEPIVFTERVRGRSKMSMAIALEAMWLVTGWGLAWRLARMRAALSSRDR